MLPLKGNLGCSVRIKHFCDATGANARKIYFNFCSSSFTSLGLAENATSFHPSPVRWATVWWALGSLYKLQLQLGLRCWWLAPHSTNGQATKVSCLCLHHHAVGIQWAKHSTSSFSKVWTNCHFVHIMALISLFFTQFSVKSVSIHLSRTDR